jgi:hypothetical protein
VAAEETDQNSTERPARIAEFWAEVDIDPVEIALPAGVGVTLRHYRTILVEPALDDDDDVDVLEPDESAQEPQTLEPEEHDDVVFLAHKGKVQLFRSEQGLIDFIKSSHPHDLSKVDTFPRVRQEATPEMVKPAEEDIYELDLVVKTLRAGHKNWDPDVLVGAGEIARDIGQACGIEEVIAALSPGSPLDDLDEALRDNGFWARRRLHKIGAETAALAWRGVIGKITQAVEWHD